MSYTEEMKNQNEEILNNEEIKTSLKLLCSKTTVLIVYTEK